MMLYVNSNVAENLFCKHVTEFAGFMLGSKLLLKIAYAAWNPVGRIDSILARVYEAGLV